MCRCSQSIYHELFAAMILWIPEDIEFEIKICCYVLSLKNVTLQLHYMFVIIYCGLPLKLKGDHHEN